MTNSTNDLPDYTAFHRKRRQSFYSLSHSRQNLNLICTVASSETTPNLHFIQKQKLHSAAFGQQANYTDCATTAGRRILVPTFADRGVSRGQRRCSPRPVVSVFYTPAATLSFE
jgi:hypothetical protein